MKSFFRIFLSLLLIPLTLECAARVDDLISNQIPFFENYSLDSLYEYDSDGKRGKPNAKYLKWELNNLGFRGDDLVPGSRRVAVVGSSETFGLYESKGKEWPQELQRLLNMGKPEDSYQVANFAYPGLLLSTLENRLADYLERTTPEILIIYPSPTGYLYRNINQSSKFERISQPDQPKFQLRVTARMMEIFKKLTPQAVRNFVVQWQLEQAVSSSEYVFEKAPEDYVKVFSSDLERMIDKILAKAIKPVLVTHATFFGDRLLEQDKSVMIAWRKFYPMLGEQGFLDMENRFNQVLRDLARKKNITLIDLAQLMPRGPEYFADAVHFTDKGAALAAQKIFGGLGK